MSRINLLALYPLVIVGSSLWKDDPRDIDLVCVIPDGDFNKTFGLTADSWREESMKGEWSRKHFDWAHDCVETGKVLQLRLLSSIGIDFRFVPGSYHDAMCRRAILE